MRDPGRGEPRVQQLRDGGALEEGRWEGGGGRVGVSPALRVCVAVPLPMLLLMLLMLLMLLTRQMVCEGNA